MCSPLLPARQSRCDAHAHLRITPRDAFGRRAYLAPLGLTVSVEGAAIRELKLGLPAPIQMRATPHPKVEIADLPSNARVSFLQMAKKPSRRV